MYLVYLRVCALPLVYLSRELFSKLQLSFASISPVAGYCDNRQHLGAITVFLPFLLLFIFFSFFFSPFVCLFAQFPARCCFLSHLIQMSLNNVNKNNSARYSNPVEVFTANLTPYFVGVVCCELFIEASVKGCQTVEGEKIRIGSRGSTFWLVTISQNKQRCEMIFKVNRESEEVVTLTEDFYLF